MNTIQKTDAPETIQNNFKTEKAPQFPFLIRRLFEFLAVSIVCSVPIALLYQTGIISLSVTWALRIMGVSLFFFAFINIYLLRAFYYSMGNRRIYFNVNLTAYLIFAIINIAILVTLRDDTLPSIYSYFFMPMKFANVILNIINESKSLGIQILAPVATHIIMFLLIVAAPLEMYSFDKKKK